MWKKILISGAVGAAILGAGGTALAASGGSSPAPNPTASSTPSTHSGHAKAKDRAGAVLRRTLHATWVTKGKDSTFVTHDAIRGIVQPGVSTTSITVKAADGTAETYQINGSTKVHVKGDSTAASAADIKSGDAVGVVGTASGTGTLTATHIVDRGTPKAASSTS